MRQREMMHYILQNTYKLLPLKSDLYATLVLRQLSVRREIAGTSCTADPGKWKVVFNDSRIGNKSI